jgi:hypothetical protein
MVLRVQRAIGKLALAAATHLNEYAPHTILRWSQYYRCRPSWAPRT